MQIESGEKIAIIFEHLCYNFLSILQKLNTAKVHVKGADLHSFHLPGFFYTSICYHYVDKVEYMVDGIVLGNNESKMNLNRTSNATENFWILLLLLDKTFIFG